MDTIGFGLYKVQADNVTSAVRHAYAAGFRHFDTAALYRNEASLGAVLEDMGLTRGPRRQDIWITTKIDFWSIQRRRTAKCFEKSLAALRLDYVDLVLLHAPSTAADNLVAWQQLEQFVASGRARYIGVSNFQTSHLDALLPNCRTRPCMNQIEVTPFHTQTALVAACRQQGIRIAAYSVLTKGQRLSDPRLCAIAQQYGCTSAQIMIAWSQAKGYLPLVTCQQPQHMKENLQRVRLTGADVAALDGFDERFATHPRFLAPATAAIATATVVASEQAVAAKEAK
jgi:2,5-diketo-D-gluconate reductase A